MLGEQGVGAGPDARPCRPAAPLLPDPDEAVGAACSLGAALVGMQEGAVPTTTEEGCLRRT